MKTCFLLLLSLALLFVSGCSNDTSSVSENDQIGNMSDSSTANISVYEVLKPVKSWSKDDTAYPEQQADPAEYVTDIFFGKFRNLVPGVGAGSGKSTPDLIGDGSQVRSQIILVADR